MKEFSLENVICSFILGLIFGGLFCGCVTGCVVNNSWENEALARGWIVRSYGAMNRNGYEDEKMDFRHKLKKESEKP